MKQTAISHYHRYEVMTSKFESKWQKRRLCELADYSASVRINRVLFQMKTLWLKKLFLKSSNSAIAFASKLPCAMWAYYWGGLACRTYTSFKRMWCLINYISEPEDLCFLSITSLRYCSVLLSQKSVSEQNHIGLLDLHVCVFFGFCTCLQVSRSSVLVIGICQFVVR